MSTVLIVALALVAWCCVSALLAAAYVAWTTRAPARRRWGSLERRSATHRHRRRRPVAGARVSLHHR